MERLESGTRSTLHQTRPKAETIMQFLHQTRAKPETIMHALLQTHLKPKMIVHALLYTHHKPDKTMEEAREMLALQLIQAYDWDGVGKYALV